MHVCFSGFPVRSCVAFQISSIVATGEDIVGISIASLFFFLSRAMLRLVEEVICRDIVGKDRDDL